jgi:predicted nucleotidyltransferase
MPEFEIPLLFRACRHARRYRRPPERIGRPLPPLRRAAAGSFRSAARGTDFDPQTSDADFLVEFDRGDDHGPLEQFFGFSEALETLLSRSVDLVEEGAISNPFILTSINKARELVYAA